MGAVIQLGKDFAFLGRSPSGKLAPVGPLSSPRCKHTSQGIVRRFTQNSLGEPNLQRGFASFPILTTPTKNTFHAPFSPHTLN